jgi:hypothetical protein
MLTLNIISQELKREIKLKSVYQLIKIVFSILIIVISIYTIILLLGKLALQIHFVETIDETTLVTKSTENYSKKVRDINNQLNSIDNIQNETTTWSYLLEYFAQNVNDNIKFSQIKINKRDKTIYLSGFAKTRDNLLSLKKTLEDSNYFSNINFPIQNLLKKNNINFTISAQLITYEFNQL